MSQILQRLQTLVLAGDVHVSEHGYDELAKDAIMLDDVVRGVATAVLVEEYASRFRGPSVLTLQRDGKDRSIHVVWALPAGNRRPAVLVTAYRPDPSLWDDDFMRRNTR
jgi:hypothetical protein